MAFIDAMAHSTIALHPEKANAQHYEIPTEFFQRVLGPHLKYSSAFWPAGLESLAEAEEASLRETIVHADLRDGQSILELGCGWGSLTLWMAAHYPQSHITAVSNSRSQKAFIESRASERGLRNIRVLTCDMNEFNIEPGQFDRVVSVEMFEHMRNWQHLFGRVHQWLKTDGKFFMHIFVHRTIPYAFEVRDASDWMSEHFFSGGMMPSDDLPLVIQGPLRLVHRWRWDGTHYEKTANAWLASMDAQREVLWPLFVQTYGASDAQSWWMRWRVFFMACAELFGYREGQEWWISHYLFENSTTPS
jgi:cyclopropane-fatty-acyl-phospholipid synthase